MRPSSPSSGFVDTDIVVVGAGVIGAAAAWQLAGRGHEVLLLDRFDTGHRYGASHGSSRLLRPADVDDRHLPLAVRSWLLWRELEAETGAELLHTCGGVDHGDPARTAQLAGRLAAQEIEHRWLTADDAAARWPGLSFSGPVVHQARRSGRIHADPATSALIAAAVGHGAQVRRGVRVEAITVRGPDRVRVSTSSGVLRSRRVVVAAGAWTRELLPGSVGAAAASGDPGATGTVPAAGGQPLRGPRHRRVRVHGRPCGRPRAGRPDHRRADRSGPGR